GGVLQGDDRDLLVGRPRWSPDGTTRSGRTRTGTARPRQTADRSHGCQPARHGTAATGSAGGARPRRRSAGEPARSSAPTASAAAPATPAHGRPRAPLEDQQRPGAGHRPRPQTWATESGCCGLREAADLTAELPPLLAVLAQQIDQRLLG